VHDRSLSSLIRDIRSCIRARFLWKSESSLMRAHALVRIREILVKRLYIGHTCQVAVIQLAIIRILHKYVHGSAVTPHISEALIYIYDVVAFVTAWRS
jgi:hypothetical protein